MKKNDRKQKLLEIAYNLFLTKGYENTSIDEMIGIAGIAKGTYYYYFKSKEEMLEEVIHMVLDQMVEKAKYVLAADIPLEQKFTGVISSFRPGPKEQGITDLINLPENIRMHEKINKRVMEEAIPILTEIVEKANEEGLLHCKENIPERIRMTLIISSGLFDERSYTGTEVALYIEIVEYLLGAKKGSLSYISELIGGGE